MLSPEEEKLVDRALVVREGSYRRREIRPAKEYSYTMHLGPEFRLGAGTYTLSATVGVHLSDSTMRVEVASTPIKVNVRRAR